MTDTYDYDVFGNTVAQSGSTVNKFRCRGEQFDVGLAMYYLRARYYRPPAGRFLTADKFEGEAKMPRGCSSKCVPAVGTHHLFDYTADDPVNYEDPSGRDSIVEYVVATLGRSRMR